MRLPAMMGLMVEEVGEGRSERLLDVDRIRNRAIPEGVGKMLLRQPSDIGHDTGVFGLARGPQVRQAFEQNGVKAVRRITRSRESLHPDAIGGQEVIERAVQGFEERTAIGAVVRIRKRGGCIVKATISPGVVGREPYHGSVWGMSHSVQSGGRGIIR